MNRFSRFDFLLLLVLSMMTAMLADSRSALAQGFSFGGSNQGNRNNDDDDDDDDDNSNRQRNRRSQNNQSGNPNSQQFQQFFPGGQGDQDGQAQGNQGTTGTNQYRRSNQQGQIQNQQLQNWGQQGGQGGITIGTWQGNKWQGTRDAKKWTQVFGGNQQPFSNQWYQDHPKAWKYDNNKTSIWVGGTLPGVYNWLGWGNVPQQYRNYYGGNVQQFDHAHYGEWYPLGVYSLMAGPGDPGTRMVQLAVDQHGHIAGNYYDLITNSNYSVSGDIRQQSQSVGWSLNKNQLVRFRAPIYQLLQPYGTLTVNLPGGEQQWQFVRLEN